MIKITVLAISTRLALASVEKCNSWNWIASNNLKFQLKSCDGKYGPYPDISMPSEVHTDLINAKVIKEDPYFRYQEENLSWITETCWQYESTPFELPSSYSKSCDLQVNFESLDSVANVYINNALVGTGHSAHRAHSFVVPASALSTSTNSNILRIEFLFALKYAKEQSVNYPYPVPATENYNVWAEPTSRNFLRKAGSDFGEYMGRLLDVIIQQQLREDFLAAKLTIKAHVEVNKDLFSSSSSDSNLGRLLSFLVTAQHATTAAITATAVQDELSRMTSQVTMKELQEQCPLSSTTAAASHRCLITIGTMTIISPKLWWPFGEGEAFLYPITVTMYEDNLPTAHAKTKMRGSSTEAKEQQATAITNSITKYIGLRTVELITVIIPSSTFSAPSSSPTSPSPSPPYPAYNTPMTYYLRINGRPIFIRGANFIPIDSFSSRIHPQQDFQYIIDSAIASQMNMLRIWGGGIYQPSAFYAYADAQGLLLWQEVMLACSLYPIHEEFLKEVEEEVQQQAIRLSSHPSIVVWGGNNENEVSFGWFTESQNHRDVYMNDYMLLYGQVVYPTLSKILGIPSVGSTGSSGSSGSSHSRGSSSSGSQQASSKSRPVASSSQTSYVWVDSSPSNGLISLTPYNKLWGAASTAAQGDVHFYDYSCDCEAYTSYPSARFISEFGFQTMPSYLSYEAVTIPEEDLLSPNSPLLQARQRHEQGNEQIEAQMSKHFQLPYLTCPPGSSSASPVTTAQQLRYTNMYLYLTTIQQSRCYETAISYWRSLHGVGSNTDGKYTMGILYWQLNDIWQGPSWASMEYGGRWKPLQYTVKRVYTPLIIRGNMLLTSSSSSGVDGVISLDIFLVNDLSTEQEVTWSLQFVPWQQQKKRDDTTTTTTIVTMTSTIHPRSSQTVWTSNTSTTVWSQETIASLSQGICSSLADCYVKATATSITSSPAASLAPSSPRLLPIYYAPLTNMKDVSLDNQLSTFISHMSLSSSATSTMAVISFQVRTNVTAPFLFLELTNTKESYQAYANHQGIFQENAGWFSDNNFLAEANQVYTLTYTSYHPITLQTFRDRLQVRALQHVYACDLSLTPIYEE